MAVRVQTGLSVFDQAVLRLHELYLGGHRLVISFSGGKDSGATVEVAIIAATMAGRLPVEVVLRDEEIMYPGTYEYAERIAARDEVAMTWLVSRHPMGNVFNRANPWWFALDPRLGPEGWVREPPPYARVMYEPSILRMTIPERFPPAEGKHLYAVTGLRASESRARMYSVFSAKSHITKKNEFGVSTVRPIYDWTDGDIWLAHKQNQWDFNEAYTIFHRLDIPRAKLRIGPPTMNNLGIGQLQVAARAWPRWFNRVCDRLEGVRTVAQFGRRAVVPRCKIGETWEETFRRECIEHAPAPWIRERATMAMNKLLNTHAHHATNPFPEVTPCVSCVSNIGSWKALTMALYNGDPFNTKVPVNVVPDLEKKVVCPWSDPIAEAAYPLGVPYAEWKQQFYGGV